MIQYKTFSRHKGMTATAMLEAQDSVRAEARAFIERELQPENIISVAECALPATWGQSLFAVTVWYRER